MQHREYCDHLQRETLMVRFSCDDCAVEEARVPAAGGSIVRPKFSIGDHGFVSIITDTEGNMVGPHSVAEA